MDGNGHTTHYAYCDCGGLDFITNALGNVTQFVHDNQGNVITAIYPDEYYVFNTFNSIQQLAARKDGAGVSVTNGFNNQGLLTTVSNAAGRVLSRTFDIDDRLTNAVDRNGVVTAMTYDKLGRLLTRSYPDGGVEGFGYSAFGLMAYTNQLTNATHYGYDAAQRKVAETNALSQTNQYGYDPAGDLVSLADANGHTTQWGYDQYGRVTNKVDATSVTQFVHDNQGKHSALGSYLNIKHFNNQGGLIAVSNAAGRVLARTFDIEDRLTNAVDQNGVATSMTYDNLGRMLTRSYPDGGVERFESKCLTF